MRNFTCIYLVILLVFSTIFILKADAHDVWLSPDKYNYAKDDSLVLHQYAGHNLEVEVELPFLKRVTPQFELITSNGKIDLLKEQIDTKSELETKPVLNRKIDFEGQAMISMVHDFFYTEISNEDFAKYLDFEDLTDRYQKKLEENPKQKERFARSLKTLVQIGNGNGSSTYDKNLGHKIELIPLNDPGKLKNGNKIKVKVLYDNKPLRDQLVFALNKDDEKGLLEMKKRTDKKGEVKFRIKREGEWLLRLAYLRHCSEVVELDCSNADWESYWAAYTFKIN